MKDENGQRGIAYSSFTIHLSSFPVMPITRTEVEQIAKLANLELTDAEKDSFSGQLAAIVEYKIGRAHV